MTHVFFINIKLQLPANMARKQYIVYNPARQKQKKDQAYIYSFFAQQQGFLIPTKGQHIKRSRVDSKKTLSDSPVGLITTRPLSLSGRDIHQEQHRLF